MSLSPDAANPLFVRSLAKAMRVLQVFDGDNRSLGLNEIAIRASLHKSAAQRFVHTFEGLGFLRRDPTTRRLSLSMKSLDFAFAFLRANPVVEAAMPIIYEPRRPGPELANLSLFDGTTLVCVLRQDAMPAHRYAAYVGRRIPSFCTAGGRTALACLSRPEREDILAQSRLERLTPQTLIDPKAILGKIEEAASDGFALAIGEARSGQLAVAAAIRDRNGSPLGAVHVMGAISDWPPGEFAAQFAPIAIGMAKAVETKVNGGSGAANHDGRRNPALAPHRAEAASFEREPNALPSEGDLVA